MSRPLGLSALRVGRWALGDERESCRENEGDDRVETSLQTRPTRYHFISLPTTPGCVIASADRMRSSWMASRRPRSSTISRIGFPVFTDSFAVSAVLVYPM